MGLVALFQQGNWGDGSSTERMQCSASWLAHIYQCNKTMHASGDKEYLIAQLCNIN